MLAEMSPAGTLANGSYTAEVGPPSTGTCVCVLEYQILDHVFRVA